MKAFFIVKLIYLKYLPLFLFSNTYITKINKKNGEKNNHSYIRNTIKKIKVRLKN